ncbi:cobalamin biosynthesis protein CobG [Streptomyces sp. NPDC004327]|uniref:cobalamin biosynthesis protein CobG n=1 Tax=Streptomyces sp. NPDC004327 TaxID=3364699 RepID=UPI0036851F4E
MLAAMPPTPPPAPERGEPVIRDRGDACPGALRLHAAADGFLARLRLPAGRLTEPQVAVLADAAEALGDGSVTVTSRGNLELRGLPDGCGDRLAGLLDRAGLLPSPTHERVRNVLASPAAGLDGLGHADVQLWARELDALLCAEPRAASLSGRFLFVLDDGREDVAGLGGDVTLIAGPAGDVRMRLGRRVFRVPAGDAVRAALTAALAFLDAAEAAGNGAWRLRELPDGHAPDWAAALAAAGIAARPVPASAPVPGPAPAPAPGPLGDRALHVLAPLGRLTAAQLRALLPAAEVRLTPWRGAVVLTDPDRLLALAAAGLVTTADAPGAGVTACTGRPGCAKSLADVRTDAGRAPAGTLPVHFAGCERRCGHPHGTWIDVVATGDDTYLVDGVPTPRTSLSEAVHSARATTR